MSLPSLGALLHAFLADELPLQKGLRPTSIKAYRDGLRLFLTFVAADARCRLTQITSDTLTLDRVLRFLQHLEDCRHNHRRTRNHRLMILHTFFEFLGRRVPECLAVAQQVADIPSKRVPPPETRFLDRDQIATLFDQLPAAGHLALRDRTLLLTLYNTGARVQELADLRVEHLEFGAQPKVRLHGKGDKWRVCPVWAQTAQLLAELINDAPPGTLSTRPVFTSQSGRPLTRFGMYKIVRRHTGQLRASEAGPARHHISPHLFRHSCAVHLLEAGVDVNVIRGWLGHVSLDTTNRYAEITVRAKEAALRLCEPPATGGSPARPQADLARRSGSTGLAGVVVSRVVDMCPPLRAPPRQPCVPTWAGTYSGRAHNCDNLIFDRRAALDALGERLLDANRTIGQPTKLATIFGRKVTKRHGGKLETVIEDLDLPNPVIRSYCRDGSIKQYVRDHLALRTEATSNNVRDFGVPKAIEQLPHLRDAMAAVTDRYLTVQQDILETFVDRGQLRHLAEPTRLPNGKRVPGLKLDHPRQLALMHALVRFAHVAGGDTFTTRDLHPRAAAALDTTPDQYRLASVRYDLSKLRAKGLVDKVPHSRRYRLLPKGYTICVVFLKLFERVYAALTAGLLHPVTADTRLADDKRHRLDRLYQRVVTDLDALLSAVGLTTAA